MFCKNCGKEMAENTKFCSYCGSENTIINQSHTSVAETQTKESQTKPKEKQKKKKANIVIVLVAVLVGGLLGKHIFAPALLSDSDEKNFSTEPSNQFKFEEIPDNAVTMLNSEYSAIFTENGIADLDTTFRGLESVAYAMQTSDGMIEKLEFGYEDDIVKEMVSTMYYPISNLSENEIKTLEANLKSYFSALEQLDFCKVTYSRMNNFYCITVTIKDLDEVENMNALAETEIFSNMSGLMISMELTEDELLDSSYVKKYVEV